METKFTKAIKKLQESGLQVTDKTYAGEVWVLLAG